MTTYSEFYKDIGFGLLLLPIIIAVSAAMLKWLNKKIAKFDISYAKAFKIKLIIGVIEITCLLALGTIGIWMNSFVIINLIGFILFFLLGAPFYAKMILHPKTGPIGWGKGVTYSLIFGIFDIVLQLLALFIPITLLSIIY